MKYRPRRVGQNRHLRDRTRLKNNSKLILSPKSNNSVLSKNDELHHLVFLDGTRVMGMYLWLNSGAKNADVRHKKNVEKATRVPDYGRRSKFYRNPKY